MMTEQVMQGVLMRYVLDEKSHQTAIPNMTTLYNWEADLLSVTRADLVHEYEIKLTAADYRRDFHDKKFKHISLQNEAYHRPNYFWYVTYQLDIEPPDYAGWMAIEPSLRIVIKRDAPRLHSGKIMESQKQDIGRLLAYRLKNVYLSLHVAEWRKLQKSQR